MRRLFFVFFILCVIVSGTVQAQENNVQMDVFPSADVAGRGGSVTLALRQTIRDHWHTYWINPGDSGESLSVTWTLPDGVTVGDIQFPTPKDIFYDPLLNYGYEGSPVYLQEIQIADDYNGDLLTLKGTASWLVCQEICIPESQDITVTIPVTDGAGSPVNQNIFAAARSGMPQKVEWATSLKKEDGVANLSVAVPVDLQNQFTDVKIYPYDWGIMETVGDVMADISDTHIDFTKTAGTRGYRGIIDPRFVIVTANGDAYEVTAKTGTPADMVAASPMPFMLVILFAFIGGLILNLMPCVFPVLSMKALSLVKLSSKERSHAQASGLAYMAGIVLSFILIAGLLIALKAGGAAIGWGFQLQNPYVVTVLATILFLVGLNLLGLFDISSRFSGFGSSLTKGNDTRASFFTGVLATLVATPCTAPFMAAAVGYALTQNAAAALLIFAVLGTGLAFPYVLLCFVPAFQKILPKPGAWMETFRHMLAFPMFASVIWLVWVLVHEAGDIAVIYILSLFLGVAFLIWLFKRHINKGIKIMALFVILAAFVGISPVLSTHDDPSYDSFSKENLDTVLNTKTDQPVFVNMTAAWCITCLVNEKTSLSTDEVKTAFKAANVIYMKGDWTNRNKEVSKFLESYGRSGVPLYVYYGRAEENGQRPAPVILPQILTPSVVLNVIEGKKKP